MDDWEKWEDRPRTVWEGPAVITDWRAIAILAVVWYLAFL